jgi:hypothetical protein
MDPAKKDSVMGMSVQVLNTGKKYFETLREWDDGIEIQKDLATGTKRRHLITHDKSTFNANDSTGYSWE